MTRSLRSSERQFVLAVLDGLAAVVAAGLAVFAWSFTSGDTFSAAFLRENVAWFAGVLGWVAALSPTRRANSALDLRATAIGLVQAAAAIFAAYLVAFFYFGTQALPRLMAVYALWNGVWLTLAARVAFVFLVSRGRFSRRLLVLGDATAHATVAALAETPALADVTVVDDGATPTDVIVAVPDLTPAIGERLLRYQEAGTSVMTLERFYESTLLRIPVSHLSESWLLVDMLGGTGPSDASPFGKRFVDVVAALGLGVLAVPVGLVAAALIWIDDRGPVFYQQPRLGRGGVRFCITKFRTMRVDAEKEGPRWSRIGDERVTRIGRWLRRTHIDELPNLWHVLKGEMSLVGPRPERPEFVQSLERDIPWYRARLTIRPGLTGWAQVMYRYGDSVEASRVKLEYDLYYIRHQSLWFDCVIVLRTIGRIVGFRGR